MKRLSSQLLVLTTLSSASANSDCQTLDHPSIAADAGICMPYAGLGTGDVSEYTEDHCGFFCNLTQSWFKVGGRRTDSSDSYGNEVAIGIAIKKSGLARSDVWITSKIGPPHWNFPLGYNSTFRQVEEILRNYSTSYVDLLLVHQPRPFDPPLSGWPTSDAECQTGSVVYNEAACRLITWRAMLEIWKSGKARAVGVSNWEIEHLQAIKDASLPMPAVNQVHLNPRQSQKELRAFCAQNSIAIQAYGSFGGSKSHGSVLKDPVVQAIAQHHKTSPAQVVLNWHWRHNISVNPGFAPCPVGSHPCDIGPQPPTEYLEENLQFIDGVELSAEDMDQIDSLDNAVDVEVV